METVEKTPSISQARGTGLPVFLRDLSAVGAAWLLSMGFDVLLHAALLARLYTEPSPFLLPADAAFRRIPLGYLSFLILTLGLFWLLRLLRLRGARPGAQCGVVAGLVVWGALTLGLYSISTASPFLLLGWWIGQSVELGLAGGVLGAAAGGVPLRRIWGLVTLVVLGCLAVTVILQTLGVAPPMRIVE